MSSRKFTLEQQKELNKLSVMTDEDIDLSDIPGRTDWTCARRGVFYMGILRKHVGRKPG